MKTKKTVRLSAASKSLLLFAGCLVVAGCQNRTQSNAELLASHDYR